MLGPFTIKEIKGKIATLQGRGIKTIANLNQLAHYLELEERKFKKKAGSLPLVRTSPPGPSSSINDCATKPNPGSICPLARSDLGSSDATQRKGWHQNDSSFRVNKVKQY